LQSGTPDDAVNIFAWYNTLFLAKFKPEIKENRVFSARRCFSGRFQGKIFVFFGKETCEKHQGMLL